MINENIQKCPYCGFKVYSQRMITYCAKCETEMIFMGKREDGKRK